MLARLPYIKPEKPICGTSTNMKQTRRIVHIMLNKKDINVFPNPWSVPKSVPDIYKKGQMKEIARIWLEASVLLNSISPIMSANTKKKTKHTIPTRKQNSVLNNIIFLICPSLPLASSSETEGRIRLAIEPVKACGNIMSGITMPLNTPNSDKAWAFVSPLSISFLGNCIVSKEDTTLINILLRLSGKESFIIDDVILSDTILFCVRFSAADEIHSMVMENIAEESSPITMPKHR